MMALEGERRERCEAAGGGMGGHLARMSRRDEDTYLSLPFQQHSNLSKMQSFSYKEQSLLRRYS